KKKNGTNAIAIMGRESLNIEIHLCLPLGLCYRFYLIRFFLCWLSLMNGFSLFELKASFEHLQVSLNFHLMKLL
ncbi:hypothetical protein, partial [Vibrio sp. OPT46]|uniref:hypothetical protein n=1 Tax=Vibrio sp. OPT46 TaxID=2778645 RepID=UPI001D153A93